MARQNQIHFLDRDLAHLAGVQVASDRIESHPVRVTVAIRINFRLRIGAACEIELTGLRNPCRQLDAFALGLMAALLERSGDGRVVRKAGVMGVVATGGTIEAGDPIRVVLPEGPHRALERV